MSTSATSGTSPSGLPLFDEPAAAAPEQAPTGDFLTDVRAFRGFGQDTVEFEEDGVRYLVNEYWTAGQRQASALHEVSYRACFKPQLPEFFISRLTEPGETVHDPFMGRGTTPIQAALMRPLDQLIVVFQNGCGPTTVRCSTLQLSI